ncbi:MAG: T9SS type A sorting domain-containing protein [Draconibacterium sp.]|nr:T9SS type A sorting domain-containing protein [Draconibacterium sp.]
MKKIIPFILFFCISLLSGIQVSAQCEPDKNCIDINKTGTFCPKNLPDGIIGEPYETVLTVIPPSEFELEGIRLNIAYIDIDSVTNFPPGITYTANAKRFYAGMSYCVLISGTPTQAGEFKLILYATPYIKYPLLGILKGPQAIDNTSVVLTVKNITGFDHLNTKQFQVYQNIPNPFSQSTRIGFYTPNRDKINLKIFNIMGELIHEESRLVSPGEHFFRFDGSELLAGSYLYLVTSSSSHLTRKLIKTR